MAAQAYTRNCFIAKYHLKQKYQEVRNGSARIGAYTKAIQTAKNKIGYDYHVDIEFEEKEGGVIQFKITASSRERANNVVQHIQGEFCDALAQTKYKNQGIRGPKEATKRLSKANQDNLQAEGHPVLLTEEALRKHDIRHMTGPCELRQFGCGPCDHPWWTVVPSNKMVSRCRECHIRYDALPREKEFGIGRFQCTKPSCKRVFFATCLATDTLRCRKCKTPVTNPYIHPRWRKHQHRSRPRSGSKKRSLNPSAVPFTPGPLVRPEPSFTPISLQSRFSAMGLSVTPPAPTSSNYVPNRVPLPITTPSQDQPTAPPSRAVARMTRAKLKVKNCSTVHNSSGSTVSTFLTQLDDGDDDDSVAGEVLLDYDSDEEGVGACRFECDCSSKYTVICEMSDTARCYECGRDNAPVGWAPPRDIDRETTNPHSCSKCNGQPDCPNLRAF